MDVSAIRAALANAVEGVSGIKQSFPTAPESINPPTFAVVEYDLDYHQTFSVGGLKFMQFTCMLWTSAASSQPGREQLDGFMTDTGPGSLLAAIEADKTLGGTCETLIVDGTSGVGRLFAIGTDAEQYFGAQINLRVWGT